MQQLRSVLLVADIRQYKFWAMLALLQDRWCKYIETTSTKLKFNRPSSTQSMDHNHVLAAGSVESQDRRNCIQMSAQRREEACGWRTTNAAVSLAGIVDGCFMLWFVISRLSERAGCCRCRTPATCRNRGISSGSALRSNQMESSTSHAVRCSLSG
jgi:hypothetical protein